MNQNLDMKGKSISLASQLSALTYVYTPTLRATNIEFWDVSNTGATDLIIKSGKTNFVAFRTINGINIYKPIIMNSKSLSGITSIAASGDITGNKRSFDTLVIAGTSTWKPLTPTSRGVYIGLDSIATGGIEIVTDTNQYIDFTTINSDYKGRITYSSTNNDFKMHVNGNASASLTLNNSTLTTNAITCGPISCTGTGTKQLSPTAAGVYLGLDTSAAGGMEICCSSSPYVDFKTISNDFKGMIIYSHGDNSFHSKLGGSYTHAMRFLSTGLSVTGSLTSSDKILKCNEKYN